MSPSADCLALVKSFENCELHAYPDPGTGGEPITIGWGHTGGVRLGDTCTQDQADEWLARGLQQAQDDVLRLVRVNLSQEQLGALTSFVYNVGATAFSKSTLLRLVNLSDFTNAASEFPKWSQSGGRFMAGLRRRRLAEQALFLKGA